ncbi:MAG: HAD family phosphatase [Candidatus Onthomorpha sp.]|nr:HAD family phosphatase [Bacteroidales bacterium]MDD7591031.1 HAD family phosphatase [Bacteroidales bacterium]MDY4861574.1 HAD family phosphatase [Candidatus Onthomorpha sp.]MDY5826125.1 HAD family phosphatase [Candidatus Onthomorpha sp.]
MKYKAFLFDFDGVIADTEHYYTDFWTIQGRIYFPDMPDFANQIKGRSLKTIYEDYFSCLPKARKQIEQALKAQEADMKYPLVSGAAEFLQLSRQYVKTALVTSSSESKMQHVYEQLPFIRESFDVIITAADIIRSKPSPECYLLAAESLGVTPDECVVFEDSEAGIQSAKNAGMKIAALATTLSRQTLMPLADTIIDNFTNQTPETIALRLDKQE